MFKTSVQEVQRIDVWSVLGGIAMFAILLIGGYFMIAG